MNGIYSTLSYTKDTASWLLKPVTSCISERVKKTVQSLVSPASTSCYTLPEKVLLSVSPLAAVSGIGMTVAAYCVAPAQAIPIGLAYTTLWYATRNPPQVLKKEIHTLRLREKQADALKGLNFANTESDQALLLEVLKDLSKENCFKVWKKFRTDLSDNEKLVSFLIKELSEGMCLGITEVTQKFLQEKSTEFSPRVLQTYLFKNRHLIVKKQIINSALCNLKSKLSELKAEKELLDKQSTSEVVKQILVLNNIMLCESSIQEAEAMFSSTSALNLKEKITSSTKTPFFPASVTSLLPSTISGSVHLHKPKVPGLSNHVFSFYTTKDQIILCDPNSSAVGIISYPKTDIRLSTLLKEHIQSYYGGEYDSVCVRTWKMPKAEPVASLVTP